MYRNKTILGLIPARGGSKGIVRKNIKLLLGKPLVAWTIEQALASKYLDKVIVSTDDVEIAKVSKEYGAEVPFIRPPKLATDSSKVVDTILHALDFFDEKSLKFDYLALLEPTSPLRKSSDIDKSIEKLIDNENIAESLISVGEIILEHPMYSKKIDKEGYVVPFLKMKEVVPIRQALPKVYFPYGVIYISKVPAIRKSKSVYPDRILPFFIERWQCYEINDIWDFICVETILKKIKEEER